MSTDVLGLEALLAADPTFEEDDEPLASQQHRDVIDSLYYLLRDRLTSGALPGRFYVAAELRVYRTLQAVAAREYREPDLLVARGQTDYQRLVYLLSEEGKAPDFVLEVLSDSTKDQDANQKRRWHRGIGVREYVIADPTGEYAGERRLQRWLLQDEDSPGNELQPTVGLEGEVISSAVLPYGLVVREGWIRLVDPASGEELPLLREELARGREEATLRRAAQAEARDEFERRLMAEARQQEAEAIAAVEAAARRVAEEENARLRQEIQRLRERDTPR